MDRSQASALADLRWHWEDAYRIDYDYRDGKWSAVPLIGSPDKIIAASDEELRHKIRDDYPERRTRLLAAEAGEHIPEAEPGF